MNPVLEHLIVLQAQDLELARLRAEIVEAPRRVSASEAARATAEKRVIALRSALSGEEKLRRDQEREIADGKIKLSRLQRSLDAATSEAQVAAFGKEMGFAQTAIAKLEEDELSSLERSDSLEAELTEAASISAQRQGELEVERQRAATVLENNRVSVEGIETQRKALRGEIQDSWLSTYDRLSKAKGTAVTEALGNSTAGRCSACQMGVRPQRWQDLIGKEHESEIFSCESCGRLLFWDPRRDAPRAWNAGDRLQQATAGSTPASRPGGAR